MSVDVGARFERLVEVMRVLRSAQGCAWDREQSLSTLRPFVLEECYELLEALDGHDLTAVREELGDVLFEMVFLAQIASEDGHFTIGDAIQAVTDKLIRRHPHVFTADGRLLADASPAISSTRVKERWEELKAAERTASPAQEKTTMSGVPAVLPALLRAYELSARAAAVGFDWEAPEDVVAKIEEEVSELRDVIDEVPLDHLRVEEEFGDFLFAVVNLSRKLGVEPEAALRLASGKFQRRFEGMERAAAAQGRAFRSLTAPEMDALWREQKHDGRSTS